MQNIFKLKPKILVHLCCAGCGAHVCELLKNNYRVIPFFYNPNIFPENEYEGRMAEAKKLSKVYKLNLEIGDYDHRNWLGLVKGHEADPERGDRCKICYRERLDKTAQIAKKNGIKYFTSTLSISPHKDFTVIKSIGEELAKEYGLNFIGQDFKKNDGFKKSVELSKQFDFKRQNYCGCEFSKKI